MKVCVQGLWHLGSVTAACLAKLGHEVVGLDPDVKAVGSLSQGRAPLFEPGLDALVAEGIASGKLSFHSDASKALDGARVLWVAFDTPVDDDDQADVVFVQTQVQAVLSYLEDGAVVLVSSQMPVGSVRKLEAYARQTFPEKAIGFAYSPENLRLGKALEVFLKPDRVVVGVREPSHRRVLQELLTPVSANVEWMSVESAEMTKHAINAFLAVSVTFANEIATICEPAGADAKEVERGLKTDVRIGSRAYVSPGGAFAGGTLARDIAFLVKETDTHQLITPLLAAVRYSNDEHKNWVRRKLVQECGSLVGVTVAIWGLTYKAGTDTLRGSLAVELCDWLLAQRAKVRVCDPVVQQIPERWQGMVMHCKDAIEAVTGARALVIGTDWPQFLQPASELGLLGQPDFIVIDANRHLKEHERALTHARIKYFAVGTPAKAERL